MAKWANDLVMDAALDKIATGTNLLVCTGQPTDRANALALALANQSLSGAFTKADGATVTLRPLALPSLLLTNQTLQSPRPVRQLTSLSSMGRSCCT